ncbi:MAG: helix-turn-helix transcriptional regulator [Lachnospiraceae bacterium]
MAKRIKEQRLAMGYTQDELAHKLGLQKSAIAKYENGRVGNIKRSIIEQMAHILNCKPSYLMGWEESIDEDQSISTYCDTEDEADLVLSYRELSDIGKKKSFNYTTGLLNTEKAELELEVNAAHALPNATEEDKQHDEDIMNSDSIWGK